MKVTITTDRNRSISFAIRLNAAIHRIRCFVAFIIRQLGYIGITAFALSVVSLFFWRTDWFKGLMHGRVLDDSRFIFGIGAIVYLATVLILMFGWARKVKIE